jgi:uncharacterized protein YecE (DUF72 family)
VQLFAGTSGWDYPEWKNGFYPADLARGRFLEHYSGRLSACEVNATFHRLHAPAAIARWRAATGEEFRFAVKAHRRLTHTGRVDTPAWEAFLRRFGDSIEPLDDRLACVLFQFPETRERDDEFLGALLERLPWNVPHAFEFRHESWEDDEVQNRIAERGGTVCLSDTVGTVPSALPPGPIAYVRLRADRYADDQREDWYSLLAKEADRRPVYAFAKHKDVPAGDPHTGIGFAEWLADRAGA